MISELKAGLSEEVLKEYPANHFDSIVTDPPYEIAFMSKKWDQTGIAYSVELWREVLRVLKPGGYLLAFGGTRTSHRMVCAIEDAGFEIRDTIQWLYGSGFPKSLSVSKAIDKYTGAEREVIGQKFNKNRGVGEIASKDLNTDSEYDPITSPATLKAQQWDGWGTALKPANEPICLARKPLSEKTVAENVLKWGTGGLNIDGCRVPLDGENKTSGGCKGTDNPVNYNFGTPFKEDNTKGRFPANVILDEEAARLLDQQAPITGAVAPVKAGQKGFGGVTIGKFKQSGDDGVTFYDDGLKGTSRFYYVAKASRSERNKGLEEFEEKFYAPSNQARAKPKRGNIDFNAWEGKDHDKRNNNNHVGSNKNTHPTVKPVKLMQYLVRLVTPPGGTVLDPFCGSGTTGIACKLEGFGFVGIDKDPENIKISLARIAGWEDDPQLKLKL